MRLLGVYPFKVYVANVFDPGLNVAIKIRHYHHPGYYTRKEEKKKFVIDPIKDDSPVEYTIPGGCSLGFNLNFGDEYLELSLDTTPDSQLFEYYIPVGAKAKCYPNESLGIPYKETFFGKGVDDEGKAFYRGGIWKVDPSNTDWVLTIQKYTFDPEEDNVAIGDVDI
jgi:hypothetical protein